MKKTITCFLILNVQFLFCQVDCFNFESNQGLSQISFDSTAGQQNIWQIGRPHKFLFDSAFSGKKVIITDSINNYPANNYSSFTLHMPVSMGIIYGMEWFQGYYKVRTDSLHDYGTMDFSPDNGNTWIDMIHDTVYSASFIWYSTKPVLSGNSRGWKPFEVDLADMGSIFNLQLTDTALFRFTFTSDSVSDSLAGLMYDDLCFYSVVEGISEIHYRPIKSKIYPNPSSSVFAIEFENPSSELFYLAVYDVNSKLTFTNDKIYNNRVVVDAQPFKPGFYFYKLTSPKTLKRSWGKFVVTK